MQSAGGRVESGGFEELVEAVAGVVTPRFAWAPPRMRSLGSECIAFWRDAGGLLFDWQEMVLEGVLGLDEDDRWVSSNDGIDVSRQNGKGVILQAVEAFAAFELGYSVVMHTAHEFATSQEHQLRLETFIQDAPHLHARVRDRGGYRHANGQESINLKSGCRIIFKARTTGGGRGYSGDLLVWDEAMVIRDAVVGAQKPMLRASQAKHGPKTIYAGSAVDQEVHEYGVNFARLRERGIARAEKVCWFEWSAPFDDLSEMTDDLMRDRTLWRAANPSIDDGLISEDDMADEIESMPKRTAAVELFGVGDWPRTDGLTDEVISVADWLGLVDERSKIVGTKWFSFDVSPDRAWASVAVAGKRKDGRQHVEVTDRRRGTNWVPGRVAELVDRHDCGGVTCDATGPATSLVHELADLGVEVTATSARDHANACGLLFDLVVDKRVRHLGQPELTSALRGATTRPLGDAWAWARRTSGTDISPLVAATLAVWGSATVPKPEVFAASW